MMLRSSGIGSVVARSVHTMLYRPARSLLNKRTRLHTLNLRPRTRSHASVAAASSSTAVRAMSTSQIPRMAFKLAWRLPLAAGLGGGAYLVAKVDEARKSVYGSIEGVSASVSDVLGAVGQAVGIAGTRAGETFDEAAQAGKGAWSSFKGLMEGMFERASSDRDSQHDSSSGEGDRKPPQTPERIVVAAAAAAALHLGSSNEADTFSPPDADSASTDLMLLTKKLIEIRSILLSIDHSESLQLPAIVVVGSQSSGKSSVLEAIVGREFLPKGNNMVTRRPIELTLVHTPATPRDPDPITYAEFPSYAPGTHITDFKVVQKTLLEHNLAIPANQAVSAVPIELRICSPNVPDLSLVDLPGYIELSSMDQPDTLKEEISNLCEKYIKEPNIILAVCAANVDLANSPALRAGRRVDPLGLRTIGVVTKMDLVEPDRGVEILTDRRYPLALGYVGVVCKADAAKKERRDLIRFGGKSEDDGGLIGPVRRQEQAFFGSYPEHFAKENLQVTTDLLKRRLMHVLEESMANSLHIVSNNVALELAEAKYQFKVQYNDRSITPESYLQETLDILKRRLNVFSNGYSKTQVRKLLKQHLDDRTMDVLAQYYWQDQSEDGDMNGLAALEKQIPQRKRQRTTSPDSVANEREAEPDPEAAWRHKLDAATSALTKSGVGRISTQLVVEAIRTHVANLLTREEPLVNHAAMSERITAFSDAILRDRYSITAEQVENCIKPLKFEIELDPDGKEWEKGRQESLRLVQREIDMCDDALAAIGDSVGGHRRLKNAMQYAADLEQREKQRLANKRAALSKKLSPPSDSKSSVVVQEDMLDPSRTVINPALLAKAREANFLSGRVGLLKARLAVLKSKQCRGYSDKTAQDIRTYCPEAFLNVVADKLASTAVMFINIELLAEYFYLFPREIETRLGYDLSHAEVVEFARENPRLKHHLDLQDRKEKLELVTNKLSALLKLQQERQAPIRQASPSSNTPSAGYRYSPFR